MKYFITLYFMYALVNATQRKKSKNKLKTLTEKTLSSAKSKYSNTFSVDFSSTSYLSTVTEQCSYTDKGCSQHYVPSYLDTDGLKKLQMLIFSNDLKHSLSSTTLPRTELELNNFNISIGVNYVITWNVKIQQYTSPYNFCFFQTFCSGVTTGPNIMLKWDNYQYQLWVLSNTQGNNKTVLNSTMVNNNVNSSIIDTYNVSTLWRVNLTLHPTNGFVIVQRQLPSESSFTTLGQMAGQTATTSSDTHYFKFGMYSQSPTASTFSTVYNMSMLISNLTILS